MALDTYDMKPKEMVAYFRYNGNHFNRKLYEWAVRQMYTKTDGEQEIEPWAKEEVDNLLKRYGVKLQNNVGYDYMYVAVMAKTDFLGRSLPTEKELALFIRDMIDDPDQADGFVMNRFFADCVLKGLPIPWEDVI